ncbi:MAG: hypothetical protein ACOCVN_02625 [bacterium]
MIITIFKIRLSQFYRILTELGLFRVIALLLIFGFALFLVFHIVMNPQNTIMALIAIGLLLLSVHTSRNDKHFIKTTIKSPYSIYLSEYLLLILPFLVIWTGHFNWMGTGLLILIVMSIPLISTHSKPGNLGSIIKILINPFSTNLNSKFKISLPFISVNSFEWISGIRRNLILLFPVYVLFLAFSFMPYVAVVGMIFISILVSGFYYYGESREFIEFYASNPREFLLRKITINLKQLIILFSPILIIALIFQSSTWYFLVGAVIISFLIQVLAIIFKYGLFEENANLNRNSFIVLINILFIILGVFWPIPIIMGIRYYAKATENLKKYFHD